MLVPAGFTEFFLGELLSRRFGGTFGEMFVPTFLLLWRDALFSIESACGEAGFSSGDHGEAGGDLIFAVREGDLRRV